MRKAAMILLMLVTLSTQGQSPSVGERIEVSIVNVEVRVTDSRGIAVHGLTAADFEIFEDGKRQPITHFAEYGVEDRLSVEQAMTTAQDTAAQVPRQRRTIIVFIDQLAVGDADRRVMFDNLKTMLRDAVQPGDAVTVASWGTILRVRLPFTDDHAAIERVLEEIAGERMITWDPEEQIAREREWLAQAGAEGFGPAALDAATRAVFDLRHKTRAINAMVRSISAMEGQKVLLLFTHRFSITAGREFLLGRGELAGPRGPVDRNFNARPLIEAVANVASESGVIVYPVFPEGLGTMHDTVSAASKLPPSTNAAAAGAKAYTVLMNETEALNHVADQTGGRAAWGVVNVSRLIPRIGVDLHSYYSLAYRGTGREGESSRIVVKTRRRDLHVRFRRQHVEKSASRKVEDRVLANLFRLPVQSELRILPTIGAIEMQGRNRCRLKLEIAFPISDLTLLRDGERHTGTFSVYVITGNAAGAVGDVVRASRTLSLSSEEIQRANDQGITYEIPMVIDGLTNRISVAVTDDVSGEQGFALIEVRGCAEGSVGS